MKVGGSGFRVRVMKVGGSGFRVRVMKVGGSGAPAVRTIGVRSYEKPLNDWEQDWGKQS
jgi:hypothetical protein